MAVQEDFRITGSGLQPSLMVSIIKDSVFNVGSHVLTNDPVNGKNSTAIDGRAIKQKKMSEGKIVLASTMVNG